VYLCAERFRLYNPGYTPSILLFENDMCFKGIAFAVEDMMQVVDDACAA
jgi:hypothetical protein